MRRYATIDELIETYLALVERTRDAGAPAIDYERWQECVIGRGGELAHLPDARCSGWLDELWRLDELMRRALPQRVGLDAWSIWVLRCAARPASRRASWQEVAAHPRCPRTRWWLEEHGEALVGGVNRALSELMARRRMWANETVTRGRVVQDRLRDGLTYREATR